MTQAALPFDICANRHRGNPESVAANPAPERKRKDILEIVEVMMMCEWVGGVTSKQIAKTLQRPLHCISGRVSELLAAGVIERTGERWEGCSMLRLKP